MITGLLVELLPIIIGGAVGSYRAIKETIDEFEETEYEDDDNDEIDSSIMNMDDEDDEEYDDEDRNYYPSKHNEITEDLYENLIEFNEVVNKMNTDEDDEDETENFMSFNEDIFVLVTKIAHDAVMCNTAYKLEDIDYIEEFGIKVGNKMNDFDALDVSDNKKASKLKEKIRRNVMDFLNLTQDYLDANCDDEDDEDEEESKELVDDPSSNYYPVMISRSTDYIISNCEGITGEYFKIETMSGNKKDFTKEKDKLKNVADLATIIKESYCEKNLEDVAKCKDLIPCAIDNIKSITPTDKNVRSAKENMIEIFININKLCNTLINEFIEPTHDENDAPIKIEYNRDR